MFIHIHDLQYMYILSSRSYIHTAQIGHAGQRSGTKYPIDVVCDNGIIHSIPTVLSPGYKKPGMDKLNGKSIIT